MRVQFQVRQSQVVMDDGQYGSESEMQDLVPLKQLQDYEWRRSSSTSSFTQRAASMPDVTAAFPLTDSRAFVPVPSR